MHLCTQLKKKRHFFLYLLAVLLLVMAFGLQRIVAQEASKQEKPKKSESSYDLPEPVEKKASVEINGEKIDYTVKAGFLDLTDDEQNVKAHIFYISYTKDKVKDPTKRPLTFSFNGGPGSSSVWLHMGVFGPRRALLNDDGSPTPPPYELVDNQYSWLNYSDFVFIDPVSTGYSRAADPKEAKEFHGFQGDIESVGDFIRRYISENERWGSPKFVAGESYGTTRASALTGHLMDKHGIFLNGTILVSAVLDFQTLRPANLNDMPYQLFLPAYTTTAWYHKELSPEMQSKSLEEVADLSRKFALEEMPVILAKGAAIPEEEKKAAAKKLKELTGLEEDFLMRADLRISPFQFFKELRREDSLTLGRFDGRYTYKDVHQNSLYWKFDPSSELGPTGPYSVMLKDYLTRELGVKTDLTYRILTGKVWPWKWDRDNQYLNTASTLATAMEKNPHMKVWVLNGYYDLATPFYATEYTLDHLWMPKSVRDNFSMTYYEAGHMMYVHKPSLQKMHQDAKNFYESALPAKK